MSSDVITFTDEAEKLPPSATFVFRRRAPDDQYIYIFDRNHQSVWMNLIKSVQTIMGTSDADVGLAAVLSSTGRSQQKSSKLIAFSDLLRAITGESSHKKGRTTTGVVPKKRTTGIPTTISAEIAIEKLITPSILKSLIDTVGGPLGVEKTRVLYIPLNIEPDDNLESLKTRLFTFCSIGPDILDGDQLYFWSDFVTTEIQPIPHTKQLTFTAINLDFPDVNPWISPNIDAEWVMEDGTKIDDNQVILNSFRTFRDLGIKNTHTIIQFVKAEDLVNTFIVNITNNLERTRWFWGYIHKYFPELIDATFIDNPYNFKQIKELREELVESLRVYQYQYKFLETINNIPIIIKSEKLRGSIRRYNIIFSHVDNADTTKLLDRGVNKTASRRINSRIRLINIQHLMMNFIPTNRIPFIHFIRSANRSRDIIKFYAVNEGATKIPLLSDIDIQSFANMVQYNGNDIMRYNLLNDEINAISFRVNWYNERNAAESLSSREYAIVNIYENGIVNIIGSIDHGHFFQYDEFINELTTFINRNLFEKIPADSYNQGVRELFNPTSHLILKQRYDYSIEFEVNERMLITKWRKAARVYAPAIRIPDESTNKIVMEYTKVSNYKYSQEIVHEISEMINSKYTADLIVERLMRVFEMKKKDAERAIINFQKQAEREMYAADNYQFATDIAEVNEIRDEQQGILMDITRVEHDFIMLAKNVKDPWYISRIYEIFRRMLNLYLSNVKLDLLIEKLDRFLAEGGADHLKPELEQAILSAEEMELRMNEMNNVLSGKSGSVELKSGLSLSVKDEENEEFGKFSGNSFANIFSGENLFLEGEDNIFVETGDHGEALHEFMKSDATKKNIKLLLDDEEDNHGKSSEEKKNDGHDVVDDDDVIIEDLSEGSESPTEHDDIDMNEEELRTELKNVANYKIKRLKRYEKRLFEVQDVGAGYARQCPETNTRQPIVLSEREYKRMIENPKYKGHDREEIIAYNPFNDRKLYYFCPMYWCIRDSIALTPDQIRENKGKCPICGGFIIGSGRASKEGGEETILERKSSYMMKDGVLVDRVFPGFLNPEKTGVCLPCCFKDSQKMDKLQQKCNTKPANLYLVDQHVKIDDNKTAAVNIQSDNDDDKTAAKYRPHMQLEFDSEDFDIFGSAQNSVFSEDEHDPNKLISEYKKQGFVFEDNKKRLAELNDRNVLETGYYIMDKNDFTSVGDGKYAYLPQHLNVLFGQKRNALLQGSKIGFIKPNIPGFWVRRGVDNNNRTSSFIDALWYHVNMTTIRTPGLALPLKLCKSRQDFLNYLADHIDILDFVRAYRGNLIHVYRPGTTEGLMSDEDVTEKIRIGLVMGKKTSFGLYLTHFYGELLPKNTRELDDINPFVFEHIRIVLTSFERFKNLLRIGVMSGKLRRANSQILDTIYYGHLWELLSMPNIAIFPHGINMIFIEMISSKKTKHIMYQLNCPDEGLYVDSQYFDENRPLLFFLKTRVNNYDVFQPIQWARMPRGRIEIEDFLTIDMLKTIRDTMEDDPYYEQYEEIYDAVVRMYKLASKQCIFEPGGRDEIVYGSRKVPVFMTGELVGMIERHNLSIPKTGGAVRRIKVETTDKLPILELTNYNRDSNNKMIGVTVRLPNKQSFFIPSLPTSWDDFRYDIGPMIYNTLHDTLTFFTLLATHFHNGYKPHGIIINRNGLINGVIFKNGLHVMITPYVPHAEWQESATWRSWYNMNLVEIHKQLYKDVASAIFIDFKEDENSEFYGTNLIIGENIPTEQWKFLWKQWFISLPDKIRKKSWQIVDNIWLLPREKREQLVELWNPFVDHSNQKLREFAAEYRNAILARKYSTKILEKHKKILEHRDLIYPDLFLEQSQMRWITYFTQNTTDLQSLRSGQLIREINDGRLLEENDHMFAIYVRNLTATALRKMRAEFIPIRFFETTQEDIQHQELLEISDFWLYKARVLRTTNVGNIRIKNVLIEEPSHAWRQLDEIKSQLSHITSQFEGQVPHVKDLYRVFIQKVSETFNKFADKKLTRGRTFISLFLERLQREGKESLISDLQTGITAGNQVRKNVKIGKQGVLINPIVVDDDDTAALNQQRRAIAATAEMSQITEEELLDRLITSPKYPVSYSDIIMMNYMLGINFILLHRKITSERLQHAKSEKGKIRRYAMLSFTRADPNANNNNINTSFSQFPFAIFVITLRETLKTWRPQVDFNYSTYQSMYLKPDNKILFNKSEFTGEFWEHFRTQINDSPLYRGYSDDNTIASGSGFHAEGNIILREDESNIKQILPAIKSLTRYLIRSEQTDE